MTESSHRRRNYRLCFAIGMLLLVSLGTYAQLNLVHGVVEGKSKFRKVIEKWTHMKSGAHHGMNEKKLHHRESKPVKAEGEAQREAEKVPAQPEGEAVSIAEEEKITHLHKTTTDANGEPLPFPVYEGAKGQEDYVPGDSANVAASEELLCRQNVIEFVINATDVKDECEGLRKAFDASCSTIERRRRLRCTHVTPSSWRDLFSSTHTLKQRLKQRLESAWDAAIPTTHRRLDTFHKPLPSLSLPTANKRVSEQTIHETVLLQNSRDASPRTNQNILPKYKRSNVGYVGMALKDLVKAQEIDDITTCCASILTVFHNHCDRDEEEEYNDELLFTIVFVITCCSLVKSLIRYYKVRWLPEAAGCILVGVVSGYVINCFPHLDFHFDEKLFLRVMLPPIVFEAALSIDKQYFRRYVIPILCYSFIGTFLSSFLTGFIVHKATFFFARFCPTIPLIDALTFGALISSIDPIAVLSVLTNMGMENTNAVYIIIFGESLLNDGAAVVLFDTLVHFLDENLVMDISAFWQATRHFFVVAFGSISVGLLCGSASIFYFWCMHGCHTPLVEVLSFISFALLPYYICDGVHWSGIVSIIAAAFIMDIYIVGEKNPKEVTLRRSSSSNLEKMFNVRGHISDTARNHLHFVTSIISTLMETAIFAYLGLFLFNWRYHWNFTHAVVAILSCICSRAIMVICMTQLASWLYKRRVPRRLKRFSVEPPPDPSIPTIAIDKRMQLILWFSGLRGAVSFALVENVPLFDTVTGHGTRFKPELKAMTSASIVFTIFVLGGGVSYVMEYIGLTIPKVPEVGEGELTGLLPEDRKLSDGELPKVGDERSNGDVERSIEKSGSSEIEMGDRLFRRTGAS